MSDQPRPVWLTEADFEMTYADFHRRVRALRDAAPADAAQAVVTALESCGIFSLKRREAAAVLRALGKA